LCDLEILNGHGGGAILILSGSGGAILIQRTCFFLIFSMGKNLFF
jgi:hypothetical protein